MEKKRHRMGLIPLACIAPRIDSIVTPVAENDRNLRYFIQEHGQIKPLIVYQDDLRHYTVIDGNRVLAALRSLGEESAYCYIHEGLSEFERTLYYLNLNLFRLPHNEVDIAKVLNKLLAHLPKNQLSLITSLTVREIEDYEKLFHFDWNQFQPIVETNQISLFDDAN